MAFAKRKQLDRRGLTLVELLMVISIMTILMVVAVPLLRPAFQDRYVREAARMVSAYFSGAQRRAAELGRPVGVWIERLDGTELGARHAVRLYMAEVPPSFSGTQLDSLVRLAVSGTVGRLQFVDSEGNANVNDAVVLNTVLAVGDPFTIKFDHKGYEYVGRRTASDFEIKIPWGVPPGADASGGGVPYEITFAPTRSAVNPLVLPADAVIDLSLSGTTSRRELDPVTTTGDATPVVVVFAPSGGVDCVYLSGSQEPLPSPLHLLIGRKARVVNPLVTTVWSPELTNLGDPTCLWVTVSNRTGAVITSDNLDTSFIAPATLPPRLTPSERIKAAREFARSSVQKGGR